MIITNYFKISLIQISLTVFSFKMFPFDKPILPLFEIKAQGSHAYLDRTLASHFVQALFLLVKYIGLILLCNMVR